MFGISGTMLAFAVVAVLLGGGIAAFVLRRFTSDLRITSAEYLCGSAILVLILLPGIGWVGGKIAQQNAIGGYVEFWNGSITSARSSEQACTRDGGCYRTYDCDPYTEIETYYETENYTDSQGKPQSRTVPKTRIVTKYHSCPYATREYSYWLTDSFGQRHNIAGSIFGAASRPFRQGVSMPGNIPRDVPQRWQSAKAHLDAGDADPATKTNEYVNYLLAAQDSLLKAYSDKIDTYRKAGLLPYHTQNLKDDPVRDGYVAKKVVTAGMGDVGDEWQQAVGRLNSQLGTELQGDLHVLVVRASLIDNPDDYTSALLAYWQSRELNKHGLAKNAIMLVVGVDDNAQTVKWSRAKTGIPQGNGELLAALSTRLDGQAFSPRTLIGWPTAKPNGKKLAFVPGNGVVEQTTLRDYPFKRPCMDCKDKGDNGSGYVYLKSSAYISTGTQVTVALFVFVLGLIVFAVLGYFDPIGAFRSARSSDTEDNPYQSSNDYWEGITPP